MYVFSITAIYHNRSALYQHTLFTHYLHRVSVNQESCIRNQSTASWIHLLHYSQIVGILTREWSVSRFHACLQNFPSLTIRLIVSVASSCNVKVPNCSPTCDIVVHQTQSGKEFPFKTDLRIRCNLMRSKLFKERVTEGYN